MRYILPLVLLCSHFFASAQQRERIAADSLLNANRKKLADTQKVINLAQVSVQFMKLNPDSGVYYGKSALAYAGRIKWKKGIIEANNSIGKNFQQMANYGKALEYYFKGLEIAEEINDKHAKAVGMHNAGRVYMANSGGDSANAKKYLIQAIALYEETGDKKGIASACNTLGSVYNNNNDFDNAIPLYNRSIRLYDSIGDIQGRVMVLSNLGVLYGNQNRQDKCLEQYLEALAMCEKHGLQTNYLLGNIGNLYGALAVDSNARFLKIIVNGDKKLALQKSIEYLRRYRDTCLKYSSLHSLFSGTHDLSVALERAGDIKGALASYKESMKWLDSLNKFNNTLTMREQQDKRDVELKTKQVELDRLAVAKKRNDRGFLIAGIVLLTIVVIFISRERRKSDKLLLNILPESIADRLKKKEHPIADHFNDVSILFVDMAGFTSFSQGRNPKNTVSTLNDIFTSFDALAEKHGLEKIKTIGDCYMAVAGLPVPRKDHALAAANMAMDIKNLMNGYKASDGTEIGFRMGLDCGPVVAGIIGKKKFIYDLWGDAVNTASRMETTGVVGEAHCTDNFKNELDDHFSFVSRGMIEIKGKGSMQTWLLN